MAKLLKGQDVALRIIQAGAVIEITDLKDFDWSIMGKIITEEHLGKTGPDKDDVYDGIRGSFNFNFGDPSFLILKTAILDRMTNRVPDTVFDVVFFYNFPDGSGRLVTLPDVKFGELPEKSPGRTEHSVATINFETGREPQIVAV